MYARNIGHIVIQIKKRRIRGEKWDTQAEPGSVLKCPGKMQRKGKSSFEGQRFDMETILITIACQ